MHINFTFEFDEEQIKLIRELGKFEEENTGCPQQILNSTKREVIESLREFDFINQELEIVFYDNDHGQEDLWLSPIGWLIFNYLEPIEESKLP